VTWPAGFTVIVNVLVDPTHEVPPLVKVGVTTMVPLIGAVVLFVAEKDMSPLPFAPSPIDVLLFVHA
jgi:hypothetical protein